LTYKYCFFYNRIVKTVELTNLKQTFPTYGIVLGIIFRKSFKQGTTMIRLFLITAMATVLCGTLFSIDAQAENQAEKYLGEREMCLDVSRIKESLVLDDQCIIFETYGGGFYVNRLPVPCHGLRIANGFAYETHYQKLCKQEIIEVLENGSATAATCVLREFVRFKYKGTINDVRKILKDGLLETLVQEGAFEGIFPQKK
jgi:hypothetical protein